VKLTFTSSVRAIQTRGLAGLRHVTRVGDDAGHDAVLRGDERGAALHVLQFGGRHLQPGLGLVQRLVADRALGMQRAQALHVLHQVLVVGPRAGVAVDHRRRSLARQAHDDIAGAHLVAFVHVDGRDAQRICRGHRVLHHALDRAGQRQPALEVAAVGRHQFDGLARRCLRRFQAGRRLGARECIEADRERGNRQHGDRRQDGRGPRDAGLHESAPVLPTASSRAACARFEA
jgi:hypothetical protein